MENKSKKRHNQVTFKAYDQDQMWLLPPSLGELIPSDHIVRLVSDAIDGLNLEPILNTYAGGGASNYHPRMLLKALVYGYIEKLYSSRKIEKALQENICFMWLCGMQRPDHHTLNRFRKGQLKDTVKDVFGQILLMLIEQGHVRLDNYFVDGTKIESVANRYTFVWAKNVARYKAGLLNKIAALVDQIEQVNEEEESSRDPAESGSQSEAAAIEDSQALAQTIERLNEQLEDRLGTDKKLKRKLEKLQKEQLPKLRQYEQQEQTLKGRSSYSKTDPDATFMRMKEDHLGNGQLKPAYNVQLGTEDQFIINYTAHQNPGDRGLLIEHLEDSRQLLACIDQTLPKRIVGDEGYGSQKNYEYMEEEGLENYVKYAGFQREQSGKHANAPFRKENLFYNAEGDFFVCPMGQRLTYRFTTKKKYKDGYRCALRIYKAQRCEGCPLRGQCHKSKDDRVIQVNRELEAYRQQARENLTSLRGIRLRQQRGIDVEPVFGHWKFNRHFRRFLLRSLTKIHIELGLLSIAHNFMKWWKKLQKPGRIVSLIPDGLPKTPQNAQMALMKQCPFKPMDQPSLRSILNHFGCLILQRPCHASHWALQFQTTELRLGS